MSARFARRNCVVCAVMLFGIFSANNVVADLTYSWSGHLRLFDNDTPDPWLIGQDGAEFVLQTTVDDASTDLNSAQIPFAEFGVTTIRLWLDGTEIPFIGGANVDFSDTADVFDLVTAGGTFSKLGQTVDISSVIGIDAMTYTFMDPTEYPPYFASTTTAVLGQAVHRPYVAVVSPGTVVSVIPEPATLTLVIFCFLGILPRLHTR